MNYEGKEGIVTKLTRCFAWVEIDTGVKQIQKRLCNVIKVKRQCALLGLYNVTEVNSFS